ncbi:hypothetical protein F5Y04DRAFT_270452 [Hypomontagnella monticulosa]|nr:hypothetical protein F5Y04DRAFT_270452 [Hypomontagnella monticulosa]
MAKPLRLTLLAEGAWSANCGIDIVAIHGLGGYSCWNTCNSTEAEGQTVSWLRDWIPADFPSARVYTYGYNPSVFFSSEGITAVADKLLDELKDARAGKTKIGLRFLSLPWPNLPWSITSFQEKLPLPGSNSLAVDQSQTELLGFPQVSLQKHHHDICRFASDDDPSYVKILETLQNVTLSPCNTDRPTAHQTPSISGKPGSGKSTLMKYLVGRSRITRSATIAYFSFIRGGNQSAMSLLSSLLYQLLEVTSGNPKVEILTHLAKRMEVFGSEKPWDYEELSSNFFEFLVKSTTLGRSFRFFIDALDECDDPGRVVTFFESLNKTLNPFQGVWTCISSRRSPSLVSALEICISDNNSSDIERYLNNKLLAWGSSLPPALDAHELVRAITEKSQGSFLWATLMMSDLLRESHLNPTKAVQHITRWLPTNLETAYQVILGRLWNSHNAQYRRIARDAFILVLCARRPLSVPELQTALAINNDANSYHTKAISLNFDALLTILCGGLLEVSPQVPKPAGSRIAVPKPTVFLLLSEASRLLLRRSSPTLGRHQRKGSKADLHFQTAEICLNYINEASMSTMGASTFDFLQYAVAYGIQHLSLASQMGIRPEATDSIWKSPPFQYGFIDRWTYLHNQFFGDQKLFKPRKTKAVHVISYFGLPWLDTGLWGVTPTDILVQDHHGQTPLSIAAAMGHLKTCQMLIKHGADVNHRDHIYGQTPLILAAAHGRQEIVKLLIRAGANSNDHTNGVSALWMAAHNAHSQIVELLLETEGANPNTTNLRTGETALCRAAALGHIPTVSLLLGRGAKVESWDRRGWTPLHHAVGRGRRTTIKLLLKVLKQDQLDRLRMGLGKAQYSWVNTVLRSIILGACYRKCTQSQTPPPNDSQETETSDAPDHNQGSTASNRKRGRDRMDSGSDKDDCEEDPGNSEKRHCHPKASGRRFACPYHRKNAAKYSSGACNGKGFQDIHRLKSHLKRAHSRVTEWQRCHICKARFAHDAIAAHWPCIRREEPIDYEDGFDAVQLNKLMSKEIFPRKSSEEQCWYTIFRVLFPDWPKTEEIPSPYQDAQTQIIPSHHQQAVAEWGNRFLSLETLNEIRDSIRHGQKPRPPPILERLYGDLRDRLRLPSTTRNIRLYQGSTVNPLLASQPVTYPRINLTPSTAPSQSTLMPPNFDPTQAPILSNSMGDYQDHYDFLPIQEHATFQSNYSHSYDSSFGRRSSAMSNSFYPNYIDPDLLTENTAFSDGDPINLRQQGNMSASGSLLSFSQQIADSVTHPSTYGQAGHDASSAYETMLTNNQGITPNYVGSRVSSSPQPQQQATPLGPWSDNAAKRLPSNDMDMEDSIVVQTRTNNEDHESGSQA